VHPDRVLERGDFHGALCVLAQFRTQRVERRLCRLGGGEDIVAAQRDPRPERPMVFLPPLAEQKESLHRVAHAQVVTRRRARLYRARRDGLGALVEFRRRQERVEVAQDRAAELLAGSSLLDRPRQYPQPRVEGPARIPCSVDLIKCLEPRALLFRRKVLIYVVLAFSNG
jgi:hypothetical protein